MHDDKGDPGLLIGPLLRYVDEGRATVWVETDRPCAVAVLAADVRSTTTTWSVHGHHYALVLLDGLPEGQVTPYTVELDGVAVWPLADSPYPPSVIRTTDLDGTYRIAFGSCRRSAPFDTRYLEELGADALVALADRMVLEDPVQWPDVLMLLGDQIYADDPSEAILERLREVNDGRHSDILEEIQDFEEYTWLYQEAWTTPAVRWLLSTVPSGMLLDDHDLRDDWNTSLSWREELTSQPWWRARATGAYGSYFVYQHLGNLSPEQLAENEVYARLTSEVDDDASTAYLDDVAWRADVDCSSIRWSFSRELGGAARRIKLVAIDTRCSRHLDPDDRRMVDGEEWAWVRQQVLEPEHPYDHLVLASTLPFLMLPGVHHLEGWDEAISEGAWGRVGKRVGEWLRQRLDLEHWAAWRGSFAEFVELLRDAVSSAEPPSDILLLGGDVHCSYIAAAELASVDHPRTAIRQLTMSPFRNDIERAAKLANKLLDRRGFSGAMHWLARRAHAEDVDLRWVMEHGLWFDNGVMSVELDGTVRIAVDHAYVDGDRQYLERTLHIDGSVATQGATDDADGAIATI